MPNEKKPQVFLSYASENLDMVRKVYDGLVKRGLNVWFDKENLKTGRWHPQIEQAILRSRYFVICLSEHSIRKIGYTDPGYQSEELRFAYEVARKRPETEFTIVPTRIENCERGTYRLEPFQQYDLFADLEKGLDKLSVDMGGVSLSDYEAIDERTENEALIDGILAKATVEILAGGYEQALFLLDSVLQSSPGNSDALNYRGYALEHLDRKEEALQAYDQALQTNPNNLGAWLGKGLLLIKDSENEKAVRVLNQALQIDPYDFGILSAKGIALLKLKKPAEALQAFEEATKIDADSANLWTHKGLALKELGKHEMAFEAFDNASKIDPNDANAWVYKGYSLYKLGKFEEALHDLDVALSVKPNHITAVLIREELKQLTDNSKKRSLWDIFRRKK